MANPEKNSKLVLVVQSPYPLSKDEPNGVSNVVQKMKDNLEKKGCDIILVGPKMKHRKENAARLTFGRTFFDVSVNNTAFKPAVSFNKERAIRINDAIKPHGIILEEPLAGHAAHTFLSGTPKREDGSFYPFIIGHFHARAENLDLKTQLLLNAAIFFRRLRFNKYGVPVGLTAGYLDTVFKNLDGSMAVSHATARFRKMIYPGECEVIYNGIDTDELTCEGEKLKEWDDGKTTFLMAGRHDERKGLDDGIRAFARLKSLGVEDIKMKITGGGKKTLELHKLVSDLQVPDVEFLGTLPRSELVKVLRSSDIFVSPATGGEGFGIILAEALSCGNMVVATDIDGYREVIRYDDPFARIAQPKDVEDLTSKMLGSYLVPKEEKERLGYLAHSYVENRFSWDKITLQTIKYYEDCFNRHGGVNREKWPKRERKNGKKKSGTLFNFRD